MSRLMEALQTEGTTTKNGMATNSSSLNECVNLFFSIGAMRGKSKEKVISLFSKAFNENPRTAMKILFWSRDVREGAGERQIFKDIMSYLATNHPQVVKINLDLIPEYGRWDDVHVLFGTKLEDDVITLLVKGLKNTETASLVSKWMPRKGLIFNKVRKTLKLTPKELRKLIVSLSNTVEQKMCSKRWVEIEYPKTPSLAMSRYTKAFGRNDKERFSQFIESLKKGDVKVNAGALYPYDVVKSLSFGNQELANEQWKALPNWMEGSNELILPMVDVSGSMSCNVSGNPNLTCMDVAISLGMYISERNEGSFKDMFMTFSSNPQIQKLLGPLSDRHRQLARADWGMSTDLEEAFKTLLRQAIKFNVSQDEMPTKVLILSDMEFNQATGDNWNNDSDWNPTAIEMIDKMYNEAGYRRPGVIFWNLHSNGGNFPARFDEIGTALISGFSPSILKSVLSNPDSLTPVNIMNETVNSERYEPITV
jgi:hypothetical protein